MSGKIAPITLRLLLLIVILALQLNESTSSKATTVTFLTHLRTLADIGDTMARTMKNSPTYYVKKLLATSSKRPSSFNSPIYKLPLKLISNAKPTGIIHGLMARPSSNIFKLPMKFLSNGKPIGVNVHSSHSFINQAMQTLNKYPTSMSNIIRLPLTFMSNGKPMGISVQNQLMSSLPSSNIINLPLQFMSNAKPFGVNFNPFLF